MATFPIDYNTFRQTPYIINFIYVGQVYSTFHEFQSVAGGTTVYLQIDVGTRIMHVFNTLINTAGGGDVLVSLYENVTLTDGTTLPNMPPQGFDRRVGSMNPATTTLFVNPTAVNLAGATLVARSRVFSLGGGQGGGDIQTESLERVLLPNTTYLMTFSVEGSNTDIALNLQFYESAN